MIHERLEGVVFADQAISEGIAWGDPVLSDPDYPGASRNLSGPRGAFDRRGAPDSPWTQDELDAFRERARRLVSTNPVAMGVLEILKSYVIGPGFQYSVVPQADEEGARHLIGRAERLLEDWRIDVDWSEQTERDLLCEIITDGETFLGIHPDDFRVVEIAPERVRDPIDFRDTPWRLGIHYDENNDPLQYAVEVSDNEFTRIPADQMIHLRCDRHRRCESEFVPVLSHLEDAELLLRNMRRGAAVQASIAFIREHGKDVVSGMLGSIRRQNAQSKRNHYGPDGETRTRYIRKYEPGAVIDVGSQGYKPGPLGAPHGTNFLSIINACYRIAGTRWQIPEYMISGEAESYRYATAIAAGTPFVRAAERHQRRFGRLFSEVQMKILEAMHMAHGWGAPHSWDDVRRRIRVEAEGHPVPVVSARGVDDDVAGTGVELATGDAKSADVR